MFLIATALALQAVFGSALQYFEQEQKEFSRDINGSQVAVYSMHFFVQQDKIDNNCPKKLTANTCITPFKDLLKNLALCHRLRMHDGYISISQICQYHIWDVLTIWVRSEKQSVVWKKQLNDGNHGHKTQCKNQG